MTQATKHTIEDLPTLRLPEWQAYYAEVLGAHSLPEQEVPDSPDHRDAGRAG